MLSFRPVGRTVVKNDRRITAKRALPLYARKVLLAFTFISYLVRCCFVSTWQRAGAGGPGAIQGVLKQ